MVLACLAASGQNREEMAVRCLAVTLVEQVLPRFPTMASGEPSVDSVLGAMDGALATLEAQLKPYLGAPLTKVLAELDALDTARLNTSLAFATTSLLYSA
jgi:hypothetical protein